MRRDAVTVPKARTQDTVMGRMEYVLAGTLMCCVREVRTASRHFHMYWERRKGSERGVSVVKKEEGFMLRMGS
jgi:hypothetical protein